ncbi:MAG: hypothetical protein JW384_00751 [Nitrosomonadaceae bacterium]|nr:hypothetical protein [Nitrosomonadaceae bacterium]
MKDLFIDTIGNDHRTHRLKPHSKEVPITPFRLNDRRAGKLSIQLEHLIVECPIRPANERDWTINPVDHTQSTPARGVEKFTSIEPGRITDMDVNIIVHPIVIDCYPKLLKRPTQGEHELVTTAIGRLSKLMPQADRNPQALALH